MVFRISILVDVHTKLKWVFQLLWLFLSKLMLVSLSSRKERPSKKERRDPVCMYLELNHQFPKYIQLSIFDCRMKYLKQSYLVFIQSFSPIISNCLSIKYSFHEMNPLDPFITVSIGTKIMRNMILIPATNWCMVIN